MSNVFRWIGARGYYFDDDLDAYYVRARHYDVLRGRWLSRDPLFWPVVNVYRQHGANLQRLIRYPTGYNGSRWNLYAYVNNNPGSSTDPSGLQQPLTPEDCQSSFDACWTAATVAFLACAAAIGESGVGLLGCIYGYLSWTRSCRVDLDICLKQCPPPPAPPVANPLPPTFPNPPLVPPARPSTPTPWPVEPDIDDTSAPPVLPSRRHW